MADTTAPTLPTTGPLATALQTAKLGVGSIVHNIVGMFASTGVAGLVGRAPIKAEPAHPKQTCADDSHGKIVGREIFVAIATPFTEHDGGNKPGNACVNMHNRAASKVQHARFREEPATPYPMGDRNIHEGKPQRGKP